MKKYLFLLIALSMQYSCEQEIVTQTHSGNFNSSLTYGGDFLLSLEVREDYMSYNNENSITWHATSMVAKFSHNNEFINVDSVYNNIESLDKGDGLIGQYSVVSMSPSTYPTNNQITWTIANYNGNSGNITHDLAKRIKITSPLKTDTIIKNNGLLINYSGSEGVGNIHYYINDGKFINESAGIDVSSDTLTKQIRGIRPDNGTITLSLSEIGTLQPNRYYYLELYHSKSDSVVFNSNSGTLFSSASSRQFFFLTN